MHKHIFNPKTHGQAVWILENSAWVTFVSRELQQRAVAIAPSIQFKSSAFWNSIQPIDFAQFTTPPLIQNLSGIIIGSTGRFRDKKGIEYLLDACAEIGQEVNITLLLIGDFIEREQAYWQQEIRNCGLGDRLHITGILSREKALAYLPHIDIFAIPSLHDGCPNALLEAMLAGCAIVGTKVDAIAEILADGTAGLLVEPGNSEDLANALRKLATNPQLRQQLGKGAKQKVLQELTPVIESEKWHNIYQQFLSPISSIHISEISIV